MQLIVSYLIWLLTFIKRLFLPRIVNEHPCLLIALRNIRNCLEGNFSPKTVRDPFGTFETGYLMFHFELK